MTEIIKTPEPNIEGILDPNETTFSSFDDDMRSMFSGHNVNLTVDFAESYRNFLAVAKKLGISMDDERVKESAVNYQWGKLELADFDKYYYNERKIEYRYLKAIDKPNHLYAAFLGISLAVSRHLCDIKVRHANHSMINASKKLSEVMRDYEKLPDHQKERMKALTN